MKREILALITAVGASGVAQAHVSEVQGMAHAAEHFWWLLTLVPAVLVLRPHAQRLLRVRQKHRE